MSPEAPSGLSTAEAARRLQADGPNELTPPQRRTLVRIVGEVVREPMFQLLVAAALIYLLLGSVGEALLLASFVLVVAATTVIQERRTEKVLDALRDLTSPRAQVVRGGEALRIAGRDVVCGDLIRLAEGDRVPADALLLSANDLLADESLLTGESVPVAKAGDGSATVFAGSLVVGGQGLGRVTATGPRSEIGRIGQSLGSIEDTPTPLNLQTRRLVKLFSWIGLGLSSAVVLLYGLTRGDWLAGLLAGITLAMSMLPQEFLLILTVFMAMGAWRLSKQRVLTRRAAAIEALGAATVLCTDKTGTLTENRMAVAELWPLPPAQAQDELLEVCVLASEPDPVDPMERAFHALAAQQLPAARRHADWTLVHEYGLLPGLMAITHVWRAADGGAQTVAVKGALEAVLPLCKTPAGQADAVARTANDMAGRGLRVLAVARGVFEGTAWPDTPHGFDFQLLGLAALADPLRPGVPAAAQDCRRAGLRVLMITGDHPATALAIARQAGLQAEAPAVTGAELEAMDDGALRACVQRTTVFARVRPEQKLRIVSALKALGEVVAMTGDGVNDAPSLKAAHIGIAMGGRGTDVAREASSLVLLDDNFQSIAQAIRGGRRIYDNLRKAMAFVLAVHVPIAGLSLLPLLLGWPLVFTPVHIVFLELLIDPVCSIVFEAEPEEADVMQRPPRDPAAPLFSAAMITASLLQGVLVLAAVALFFWLMLRRGLPEGEARAAAFTALVACDVGLILVNRALAGPLLQALRRPNPALWRTVAATAALLAVALFVPPVRGLFRFAPVAPAWLGAALGLALAVTLALEILKWLTQLRRLGRLQRRPA